MYRRWFSVAGTAGVVAGVLQRRTSDCQPGLRPGPRLGLHGDAAARRVVVDHPLVVVPEYVLGWRWTLEFYMLLLWLLEFFGSLFLCHL